MAKIYPSAVMALIAGPIRVEEDDGRTILTHLQKYSHFGFMITRPFCIHFWLFWKLQERNPFLEVWRPGTERGIYTRTPGYRWDKDLGMKWTWGYFGLHWD